MTFSVILTQLKDPDEDRRRAEIKAWWLENLTGKVTAQQSMIVNVIEVIDGKLVETQERLWTFTFSKQVDAVQFKLVFG